MKFMAAKKTILIVLALLLLIISGCGGAKLNTDPDDIAPEFELTNTLGETISLANTDGKVRLLYFYFSSCETVCLPTTHLLSQVQEQLKAEDVFATETDIFSITFDPARDTQERLVEYSGYYNADYSGWHFLRGEEQYTRALAKEYKVDVIDSKDGQFIHSNLIFLINQEGYIEKYYIPTMDVDAETIVKDMLALL